MKKGNRSKPADPEMRAHYDIPWDKAVRGKYAGRFKKSGCYAVFVDLDLKRYFPDDIAVNSALHALADIAQHNAKGRARA